MNIQALQAQLTIHVRMMVLIGSIHGLAGIVLKQGNVGEMQRGPPSSPLKHVL